MPSKYNSDKFYQILEFHKCICECKLKDLTERHYILKKKL